LLTITNNVMVQNYEVTSNKFNVVRIDASGNVQRDGSVKCMVFNLYWLLLTLPYRQTFEVS